MAHRPPKLGLAAWSLIDHAQRRIAHVVLIDVAKLASAAFSMAALRNCSGDIFFIDVPKHGSLAFLLPGPGIADELQTLVPRILV